MKSNWFFLCLIALALHAVVASAASEDEIRNAALTVVAQMKIPATYKSIKKLDGWYEVTYKVKGQNKVGMSVYVSDNAEDVVVGEVWHKGKPLSILTRHMSQAPRNLTLSGTGRPAIGEGAEDVFVFLSPSAPDYEDILKRFHEMPKRGGMRYVLKFFAEPKDRERAAEAYMKFLSSIGKQLPLEQVKSIVDEDSREAKENAITKSATIVARGMIFRPSM